MSRSIHYAAKYKRKCKYCGQEFMSKKKAGEVCYAEPCQRQNERDRARRRYLRSKERDDESTNASDQS